MIVFPNAKINLGLSVIAKRKDGFHDIETVFYPVDLSDILEIQGASPEQDPAFTETGLISGVPAGKNLCYRAMKLLEEDYPIPSTIVHLHKLIPNGAGLGGGSSDAAFMLKCLNSYYKLGIEPARLQEYASQLGADCSFFIPNRPVFAWGKGDVFRDIDISLKDYFILIVKPPFSISTVEAYSMCQPAPAKLSVFDAVKRPVEEWKHLLVNDFEKVMEKKFPGALRIKEDLYSLGAVFSLMSGSGSSFYGIFKEKPDDSLFRKSGYFTWSSSLPLS